MEEAGRLSRRFRGWHMSCSYPAVMNVVEQAVLERYSAGAVECEASLCCAAATYDPALLEAIPREVLDIDYGCGDPSRYVCAGETVLDLGSGSGKHCFIAAQIVGARGKVIGVDMNDDMLALARAAAPKVAGKLGYANVEIVRSKIQDMRGAIADGNVDVVISNCVLNLVSPEDKHALFSEIYRVLRAGGRTVIADIVSNKPVPRHMQEDPELWSGCISGAFEETDFIGAFADAGFSDIEILEHSEQPWRVVEDIEFRAMTVRARRGEAKTTSCCG